MQVTSCRKTEIGKLQDEAYTGTFQRQQSSGQSTPSNVSITFAAGKFSGQSDRANYPAICNGSYSVSGAKLNVANACMFTANFDWSLIFGGEYNYTLNEKSLKIWRTNNDGSVDMYQLQRAQ